MSQAESSVGPDESVSNPAADVDMGETGEAGDAEGDVAGDDTELPFADEDIVPPRPTFASYLASPIVSLVIGSEAPSILSAHQALLEQSPFFAAACTSFTDDAVNNLCATET